MRQSSVYLHDAFDDYEAGQELNNLGQILMRVAFKALVEHGEWCFTVTDGYIDWRTATSSYRFPITISVGSEEFLNAIKRDLGKGFYHRNHEDLLRSLAKWRDAIREAETAVHERAVSDAAKDESGFPGNRYRILRSGHPTDTVLLGLGPNWFIDSVSDPRESWSDWYDSLDSAHEAAAELLGCDIHLTSLQKLHASG
jgi:hypothetical protein